MSDPFPSSFLFLADALTTYKAEQACIRILTCWVIFFDQPPPSAKRFLAFQARICTN
jgi:hypothetical protein